jgi:hypothetical protein
MPRQLLLAAPVDVHEVDIGVARVHLDTAREGEPPPVGRPGRLPGRDGILGHPPLPASVGVHDVEVGDVGVVASGRERDRLPVGRPGRAVAAEVAGEVSLSAAVGVHDEDLGVADPTLPDGGAEPLPEGEFAPVRRPHRTPKIRLRTQTRCVAHQPPHTAAVGVHDVELGLHETAAPRGLENTGHEGDPWRRRPGGWAGIRSGGGRSSLRLGGEVEHGD